MTPAAESEAGREIELTSAMGRVSGVQIEYLPTRDVRRTNRDSAGLTSTFLATTKGTYEASYPGGVTVESATVPDALYEPLVEDWSSASISVPGLRADLFHESTGLTAPDDPPDRARGAEHGR